MQPYLEYYIHIVVSHQHVQINYLEFISERHLKKVVFLGK